MILTEGKEKRNASQAGFSLIEAMVAIAIFAIGIVSEFAAAMFPTLFFVMLGDAADYSEFRKRVMFSRNAFPDLRFDIQEMVEGNEMVVVRWIMSGTHEGDIPMIPATGKSFSIAGMTFY